MGVLKIDYNRGVLKKVTKEGIEVFMYLDLPGVYYNSFEREVSEQLAAEAGYDVQKFGKMRRRREQLAVAMEAIDQELEMEEYNEKRVVIEERGGFSLVSIGLGRHIIEDPEGGKLVDRPLTLEEAKTALNKLVPMEPETVEPKVKVKNLAKAS